VKITKTVWGSLRRLHTSFLTWCAATRTEPNTEALLRWLCNDDLALTRDGWTLECYEAQAEKQPQSVDQADPTATGNPE
jgi:hypothetical protein